MNSYTSNTRAIARPNLTNLVRKVCIPAPLMSEIDAFGLKGLARDVIYWIVYRSVTHKKGKQPIACKVLDKGLSAYARRRIKDFIKQSNYLIESPGRYQTSERSLCYELNPNTVTIERQHNNGSVGGRVVWRSVDFGCLLGRVRVAWDVLGYEQSVYDAQWSLEQVDEPAFPLESVTGDELKKNGVCLKKRRKSGTSDYDQLAHEHRLAMSRFWNDRMSGIFRRDGRQYHSGLSIPRWIRRRVIRFQSKSETVDVSGCYIWIMAARHRRSRVRAGLDTKKVDELLELIETGQFYSRLSEVAGCDVGDAKTQFQIFCLFGDLEKSRLWFALRELCPGVCGDIQWWRDQPCGASRLSDMLQRGEGNLIDPLVRYLVSNGVPAVRIHDGIEVPEGAAKMAADWLSERSRELYGRSCRVSVVVNGVKTHV